MNGQTLNKAFIPLPAGATAVYTSGPTLSYYRHPDWLGSSRFASTPSRTMYSDLAYAPFGETYAEAGTPDRSFTGQNQDTVPDSTAGLYDFLYREYAQYGRWISPDPAGTAAVDITNPQTWNRYAYVVNSPLTLIDPVGLDWCIGYLRGTSEDGYWADPFFCSSYLQRLGPYLLEDWAILKSLWQKTHPNGSQNPPKVDCSQPPPAPPAAPPGVDVNANIQQGQTIGETVATEPQTGVTFDPTTPYLYSQFQTGGPQDYKSQYGQQYVPFGNFNYGAVCGAVGNSLTFCQSAAGLALVGRTAKFEGKYALGLSPRPPNYNGAGIPFVTPPYGDQPADSAQIAQGYGYQQWIAQCRNGG